jgi:hypothetical protein
VQEVGFDCTLAESGETPLLSRPDEWQEITAFAPLPRLARSASKLYSSNPQQIEMRRPAFLFSRNYRHQKKALGSRTQRLDYVFYQM